MAHRFGIVSSVPKTPIGAWATRGNCLGTDPEALFVQGSAQHQAKRVCAGCPVKLECLAAALDNRIEFGVWGGLTERERRVVLRRRPGVDSWLEVLQQSVTAAQQSNAS